MKGNIEQKWVKHIAWKVHLDTFQLVAITINELKQKKMFKINTTQKY